MSSNGSPKSTTTYSYIVCTAKISETVSTTLRALVSYVGYTIVRHAYNRNATFVTWEH